MSYFNGYDQLLYIKIDGVWVPIGCLTSNSFTESVEMLNTTTRDTGGWNTWLPTNQEYSIPFTGIQVKTVDNTRVSYDSLKLIKRDRTRIEWKLENLSNGIIDYGEGYIRSIGEVQESQGVATFEGEILGYAKPINQVDNTPPTAPYLEPFTVVSGTEVGLLWTKSTDDFRVDGYEIWRSEGGGPFLLHDTVDRFSLSYSDYSVVGGRIYYYNVRAFDTSGNFSPYSNKRRTPIIPVTPTFNYLLLEDGGNLLLETGAPALIE